MSNSSGEKLLTEQPQRLIILSKDAGSVRSTLAFLTKRQVDVFATTNFQEAIDKLASGWTRFILLSVNFPHPKIEMVPQLLAQSFGAESLVFAELSDRKTSSKLSATKSKHVIFGSVSGPVVLMRLSQIMREAEQVKAEEQTGVARAASGSAEVEQIHLKDRGTVEQKIEGFKKLMSALGSAEEDRSQSKKSVPAVVIQKGNRGQMMLHVPPPNRSQKRGIKEAISIGRLARAQPQIGERHIRPPSVMEGSASAFVQPSTTIPLVGERTAQDLLDRCLRSALTACCGWPRDEKDVMIEYQSVSVLIFTTSFFQGTVVFAIGRGKFDHQEMLKSIETEFVFQVIQSGVDIGVGELERFEISPAASAEDAFFAATKSAVSRSEDFEVGVAVLDLVPEVPDVVDTPDQMIAVKPESIAVETNLDFEVFLYLPLNGRYVRYVREGGKMSREQSSRLTVRPKSSVYLTKSASAAFREHVSINSLKQKLQKKIG